MAIFRCRQWKIVHQALCEPVNFPSINIHLFIYNVSECVEIDFILHKDFNLNYNGFTLVFLIMSYDDFLLGFSQMTNPDLGQMCSNVAETVAHTALHHLLPALSEILDVPIRSLCLPRVTVYPEELSHWYVLQYLNARLSVLRCAQILVSARVTALFAKHPVT